MAKENKINANQDDINWIKKISTILDDRKIHPDLISAYDLIKDEYKNDTDETSALFNVTKIMFYKTEQAYQPSDIADFLMSYLYGQPNIDKLVYSTGLEEALHTYMQGGTK